MVLPSRVSAPGFSWAAIVQYLDSSGEYACVNSGGEHWLEDEVASMRSGALLVRR
jgi:hypothetical protein